METQVQEISKEIHKFPQYIEDKLPAITGFCLRIVIALLVFWLGGKLIRWLLKFIKRSLGRANIDEGVVQFACSLSKVVLYALLIFNIATYFGVKESSVAALLGTAGVTIGLALQGGLANIAGGMMILIFKPFQVGDYIVQSGQVGCEGTVIKIEICYTTLLSIDNKHVIIPNGTLSNSIITNVTARTEKTGNQGWNFLSVRYAQGKGDFGTSLKGRSGYKRRRGHGSVCRQPWRQLCCYGISCMGSY